MFRIQTPEPTSKRGKHSKHQSHQRCFVSRIQFESEGLVDRVAPWIKYTLNESEEERLGAEIP